MKMCVYHEGALARYHGGTEADNPYAELSGCEVEASFWLRGFRNINYPVGAK